MDPLIPISQGWINFLLVALLVTVGGLRITKGFWPRFRLVLLAIVLFAILISPTVTTYIDKIIKSQFLPETRFAWPAPMEEVRLGTQQMTFRYIGPNGLTIVRGTAAYWLESGSVLIAAHHVTEFGKSGPLPVEMALTLTKGVPQDLVGQILFNDERGLALRLPKAYLPPTPFYPIAGTGEIQIGEKAEVLSVYGGSFPVMVIGYYQSTGLDRIVVERISRADHFLGGMSGSPVIQNGKIIGFLSSIITKRPRFALLYVGAQLYKEATPEMRSHRPLPTIPRTQNKPHPWRRPLSLHPPALS